MAGGAPASLRARTCARAGGNRRSVVVLDEDRRGAKAFVNLIAAVVNDAESYACRAIGNAIVNGVYRKTMERKGVGRFGDRYRGRSVCCDAACRVTPLQADRKARRRRRIRGSAEGNWRRYCIRSATDHDRNAGTRRRTRGSVATASDLGREPMPAAAETGGRHAAQAELAKASRCWVRERCASGAGPSRPSGSMLSWRRPPNAGCARGAHPAQRLLGPAGSMLSWRRPPDAGCARGAHRALGLLGPAALC